LAVLIIAHGKLRAVPFQAERMRGARGDRHDLAPIDYITLATSMIPNGRDRSVRSKTDAMTTTRGYGVFRPTSHLERRFLR
jgi:hypothetical protein